ncbi:MAG TPA: hypothetical protein VHE77_14825 [Dongiaceae bacterium]|jgi:hypothetical protein|nr:hypothetical protein [Dongiaceae bacterium]
MTESQDQVWLLEPEAAPEDSWWQGRPIWQVAVTAPSAAFARLEAERWALDQMPRHHIGNESPALNAGFIDQRLYRARALAETEGPRPEEFDSSPVLVLAGPMASLAGS